MATARSHLAAAPSIPASSIFQPWDMNAPNTIASVMDGHATRRGPAVRIPRRRWEPRAFRRLTAAPGDGPTELDVTTVLPAVTADRPEAEALVFRDRRLTRRDVDERTDRLAHLLRGAGLGCHAER